MDIPAFLSKKILAAGLVLAIAGCQTVASKSQAQQPADGVRVEQPSQLRSLVPAEQLERAASQQFSKMKQAAAKKGQLAPDNHPQLIRLRRIADELKPQAKLWNQNAGSWQWEVQLFLNDSINAFCMPGGKIGFYSGILEKLKLTDDEVAVIMGHEMAHALREHSRAQIAKSQLTSIGAGVLSSVLGVGDVGRTLMDYGVQLTMLKFSRDDENDADLVGLDISSRGGFDPRAGVTLWRKMSAASKNTPPQWLSTHPSGTNRIGQIERNLDLVLPLYARAIGKTLETLPPDPRLQ
jgi:Zn-dependent protease with chaperone function